MTLERFRFWPRGLSARLLVLTIAFVTLGEVFVYLPAIGRFQRDHLEAFVADARLASLALAASPDLRVSDALGRELLEGAGSYGIVLRRLDRKAMVLSRDMPHDVSAVIDLREGGLASRSIEALRTVCGDGMRMIRLIGPWAGEPDVLVETVIDEAPLRAAMIAFSKRMLAQSITISLIWASLLYLGLQWLVVSPVKRLTDSAIAFGNDPEGPARAAAPSGRADEIGRAESALANMQKDLRAALQQRERLARLGASITKINHDLRNILATAQLVADTVSSSDDPKVRRVAPTLLGAIDRAIALCSQTLNYAAGSAEAPEIRPFALAPLVDELISTLGADAPREVKWVNRVDAEFYLSADSVKAYRVLANLARNAMEAGAGVITFDATAEDDFAAIEIVDDGHGLAPRAREKLFQPFAGSTRPGGTGLGLAIARELARAHGGELVLAETGANGTTFRLTLPNRGVAAATRKRSFPRLVKG